MRQCIHIFLKDARSLRIDIFLFLAFAAIWAWATPSAPYPVRIGAEILLEVTAIYLIARVVHAETIPGHRQFWLTRPYHWMSLAGSKLLFVAAFVCAPICAAQVTMLVAGGFPLLSSIPGLLWSQVLIFFAGAIFIVALAAITSGTVLFMLSVLPLAAIALISEFIYPVAGTYRPPQPALEWIRQYSVLIVFALTAALVLISQYRNRATTFSRTAGIGGMALAIAIFLWMPSSFLFGVQSVLPRKPDAGTVHVSIDPSIKGSTTWLSGGRDPLYRRFRIPLPIAVQGLPEGVEARVDALSISFEWTGEGNWKPDVPAGLNPRSDAPGASLSDATVLMDPALYWRNRDSPMTLTGAVYLTLFGDTETRTVALRNRPANFQDGLQCFVGELNYVYCRSFFRWPARLVSAESGGTPYTFLNSLISYSPFPADIGLSPLETRGGGELKTPELP